MTPPSPVPAPARPTQRLVAPEPARPWPVYAVTRHDGTVLLGSYASKGAQSAALTRERELLVHQGGDVLDIVTELETARYRITLTDYLGNVTERYAGTRQTALAISNDALHAQRPDARNRDGKTSTARRKPLYLECRTTHVAEGGTEKGCGQWRQAEEAVNHGPRERVAEEADRGLALLALALGGAGDTQIPANDQSQSFAQLRMETVK